MRVIITGGTGLIGRPLVASLAQDGHEVIVLSRSPGRYAFPEGARGVQWDGRTAQDWGLLADGADVIVNLAGESIAGTGFIPSRWTAARKQRILDSRLNAGNAVVEAVQAATSRPDLVIQASGVDVYGDRGSEVITEASDLVGSGFLAKVAAPWEASTAAVEAMGVRHVIIRTGLLLSPEGGPLRLMALPFRLFVGGPLGSGRQWLSWIHPEDEIAAIRFLIANETATGPFNLCAPEPVTYRQLARILGQVLKRPSFIPVPSFALRLVLGETADLVLHGRRALPSRLQELGFRFRYGELQPALTDLLNR